MARFVILPSSRDRDMEKGTGNNPVSACVRAHIFANKNCIKYKGNRRVRRSRGGAANGQQRSICDWVNEPTKWSPHGGTLGETRAFETPPIVAISAMAYQRHRQESEHLWLDCYYRPYYHWREDTRNSCQREMKQTQKDQEHVAKITKLQQLKVC